MNTTNLFVELIVIGVGAFAWLLMLALTLSGVDLPLLQTLVSSPVAAIPALAVIYLLGIITDRLADGLFHAIRMDSKHQRQYPGGRDQYFRDRAFVLAHSDQFAQHYEYSRSRQRICRGWTLNSLALLISALALVTVRLSGLVDVSLVITLCGVVLVPLALACWWSWEALSDSQLQQIHSQADVLRDRQTSA